MDWDLWGPSYSQVAPESSCQMRPGCQRDLYFGYGLDVLEETALNAKCCVHVLRILITNADTEIDELEKDLVVLQSELAWAEYEEWSEICCTALREKIDCLNTSIWSLRKENEHDINVHLLMYREPADRIHEILKVLLKNYCQEKDEQALDIIVKDSISDALEHATDLSDEMKKLCNFNSNIIIKEEIKELDVTPAETCTVIDSFLKHQGKETDYPETVKPADIIVRSSNVDSLNSNGNIELRNSVSNIVREEVKEPSSIPKTEIITLDSSFKPGEKRTDHGGKVKPANSTFEGSSSDALRHAIGNSNENKNLGKSDSKVNGREEVKEQNSTPTERSIILNSSLNSAQKGTILPKTDKPANVIVKDYSSDALRHATCLNGKRKLSNSDSRLNALRWAKSGESSAKPKLSNFTSKTAPNGGIKESKDSLASKIETSKSSLKTEGKKMNKVQDTDLTDTEHYTTTSLLEQQIPSGEDAAKTHPEEEVLPQAEDVQKVEIVANEKSNLNLSLESRRQKAKRKIQSNPVSVQELGSLRIETGSNSSSISKGKMRRKSGINDDNSTLVQFLNGKMWKKLVNPDRREAEECGIGPDISEKSVSVSQKRRKTTPVLPIIVEIKNFTFHNDISKSHGDRTESSSKEDNPNTKSYSVENPDNETQTSLPTSRLVNLNDLTVNDLKAIAREYKLRKYYKLRRVDLVKLLANQLG